MTYTLLKFAHVLGAILMGAGLIGVHTETLSAGNREVRSHP